MLIARNAYQKKVGPRFFLAPRTCNFMLVSPPHSAMLMPCGNNGGTMTHVSDDVYLLSQNGCLTVDRWKQSAAPPAPARGTQKIRSSWGKRLTTKSYAFLCKSLSLSMHIYLYICIIIHIYYICPPIVWIIHRFPKYLLGVHFWITQLRPSRENLQVMDQEFGPPSRMRAQTWEHHWVRMLQASWPWGGEALCLIKFHTL